MESFPLLILLLLSFFTKSLIISLLSAIYVFITLVWNGTNVFLLYTAQRVLDYDIVQQILPEAVNAFHAITISELALVGLFLILIFFVSRLFFATAYKLGKTKAKKYTLVLICSVCFLVTLFYIVKGYDVESRRSWISQPVWKSVWNITEVWQQSRKLPVTAPLVPSPVEAQALREAGLLQERLPAGRLNIRNIIIVALESYNYDFLQETDNQIPAVATKNMQKLQKISIFFNNYYTSASPTVRGLHAIFASRLDNDTDEGFAPNLFSILRDNGFRTYYLNAVSGEWASLSCGQVNFSLRYGPAIMHYREFYDDKYRKVVEGWGIESGPLFEDAISIISRSNEKNFIVISTIETHAPYTTASRHTASCQKEPGMDNKPFHIALCATDKALGDFYAQLEPHLDDTLLIVTADHSNTHGLQHGGHISGPAARIPLFFISRADLSALGTVGTERANYCSQIDLAPTLLNLLGIDVPETFMGGDLRYRNIACTFLNADRKLRLISDKGESIHDPDDAHSLPARWFRLHYPRHAQ